MQSLAGGVQMLDFLTYIGAVSMLHSHSVTTRAGRLIGLCSIIATVRTYFRLNTAPEKLPRRQRDVAELSESSRLVLGYSQRDVTVICLLRILIV